MSERDIVYDAQGRVIAITEFDANSVATYTYYDCGGEGIAASGTDENVAPASEGAAGASAENEDGRNRS